MAVVVSFYSYQGKPNVAVKSFGNVVTTKTLNFVTNTMPEMKFDIECSTKEAANYCTWEVDNVTQYWFIDSIEGDKDIYIYHLSLDYLTTYWERIKNENQLIERSSSIVPTSYMQDTLWKTGKKSSVGIRTTSHASQFVKDFSSTSNPKCIVLAGVVPYYVPIPNVNAPLDSAQSRTIAIYALTRNEMGMVANAMWSADIIDSIKRVFAANPADCVCSVMMFPFDVAAFIDAAYLATKNIMLGTVELTLSGQTLTGTALGNTICDLNLGTITCTRPFGDFRDYEPYSSYRIWLPYLGTFDIPMNDFFNYGSMTIKYFVNVLTGETIARIYADTDSEPRLIFTGTMGTRIPLSTSNAADTFRDLVSGVVSSGVSMIASKELGVVERTSHSMVSGDSETISKIYDPNNIRKIASKNSLAKSYSHESFADSSSQSGYGTYRGAIAGSTFLNSFSKHPEVRVVSSYAGNTYRQLNNKPYLIYHCVETISDTKQNEIYGKLVMKDEVLKNLTGFAKITNCNIPMKGMRLDVYNALIAMLESGFYVS